MLHRPVREWQFALLCGIAVAAGAVFADGPPPLPQTHKIYVDEVHNKLFWPMDKPFWVRLATSPEPDAPSYLLQRVAPASDVPTDHYDKQGIALEIQGSQFIRWFNIVTKQTENLEFFSDGEPPTSKLSCTGAPAAVDSAKSFYGKGLHCALASEDALSGVETTFISLNDEAYKPYSGELVLDQEMDVVLRYYAVDHVGYAEAPAARRFTVDLSPPTTTHQVLGTALDDVLSSKASFGLSSKDALSGVAGIQSRFDDQDFKPATAAITVDKLPDGEHTLSYFAVDRVGNREAEHDFHFYLDRLPPTVDSQVSGDLWLASNGARYVSSRSRVVLSAQDNKSGVASIDYTLGEAGFQQYEQPLALPAKAGAAKLSYRAADKLGNTSSVANLPYIMDLAPPQSAYHVVGPMFVQRSDVFITRNTRIELSANDDLSGVQKIEFEIEGEAQFQPYVAPLMFADEGRRLLRYASTDQVNNRRAGARGGADHR